MTTTKTTKRQRTTSPEPASDLQAFVRGRLDDSKPLTGANSELARLRTDKAKRQHRLDQLLAQQSDVEGLVSKIQSGENLEATDSADEIRILRDQLKAFDIAIGRAEKDRQAVLQSLSVEITEDLQADHRQRIADVSDALMALVESVPKLMEIPGTLSRNGLTDDPAKLPRCHFSELMGMRARLQFLNADCLRHLEGGA